jgi:DNA repair protein RadA/Sms
MAAMEFRCPACGHGSPKWMGFCPQCRSGVALVEAAGPAAAVAPARTVPLAEAVTAVLDRTAIGMPEVDRVLGGGLVAGATILLGGEPGVGKSTLALHLAAGLARRGGTTLVAGAEESPDQVALRADRLGIEGTAVHLSGDRDVDAIVAAAEVLRPDLLVVDSVQAITVAEVGGTAGGVAQVREAAGRLIHFAKDRGVPLILIGHVTKDGLIAGPKVLEHAVDVVLSLEGDPERGLRMLRCLKNRFGATHQVGLFEMGEAGLSEVADPGGLLAGERGAAPGSIVFPAMHGRRPLLVEIQALVAGTRPGQARRSVKGLEAARLHQVLAVLERHAGLPLSGLDVYVGVAGGLRLQDPGADLPVALAVVSSLLDHPLGAVAAWGEVGLTGEVRPVVHGDRRAAEAHRLGLTPLADPGSGERLTAVLARAGLDGRADASRTPSVVASPPDGFA